LISFKNYAQNEDFITYNPEKKYTQEYIDSLITVLKVARKKMIEPQEFKKILESNPNLSGWTFYYLGKSVVSFREKKFDSTLYYANQGINKYNASRIHREFNKQDLMLLYHYKGDAYTDLGKYNEAILNYQNALNISKEQPYLYSGAFTAGIAAAHYRIGNDSLALKYYLDVSKDSAFMSFPKAKVSTLERIGSLFKEFGDLNQAENYYKSSVEASLDTEYMNGINSIYGNLGDLAHINNKPDSTLYYYKKAVEAEKDYDVESHLIGNAESNEYYRAYVKIEEGNINEGIQDLKKLIRKINDLEIKTKNEIRLMLNVLNTLGRAYQKKGNYREYETLITESFTFLESFREIQLKQNVQELELKYKTKEKEASIVQLEQNEKQQNIIIRQQRIFAIILGGFLVLLFFIGALFWKQNKLKNTYEKENLKQQLLRSQMNPHFIGNAMYALSILVKKQSANAIPYINKLSRLFRSILTNSREEFVYLSEEVEILESYLELQSEFSKKFSYTIIVNRDIKADELVIPPMLIQPFIENAIIHGINHLEDRGEIIISISLDDKGLLLCNIKDNGIGYKKSVQLKPKLNNNSISGSIVKERLEIFKKKYKVNSRYSIYDDIIGTKVELYLPYLIDR